MWLKFCTACPAAPLPRLSRQETTTRRRPDLSRAKPMSQKLVCATCCNSGRVPAVKHLHVCGGLRLLEGDVNGGKNAARERQQVGRKNHLLLCQARVIKNFRRMAVREEAIGLEILIHLDK